MPTFSNGSPGNGSPGVGQRTPVQPARQPAPPAAITLTPVVWASGTVRTDGCFGTYLNFLYQFPEYRGRGYGGNTASPDNDAALEAFANRFPLCAPWAQQAATQRNAFQAQANCQYPPQSFDNYTGPPMTNAQIRAWNAANPMCPPLAQFPCSPPTAWTSDAERAAWIAANPSCDQPPPFQGTTQTPPPQTQAVSGGTLLLGAVLIGGLIWFATKE